MRKFNVTKSNLNEVLEQNSFIYKESDYYFDPVVGKEIVRFRWGNPKYKDHFVTYLKIRYFDDFIMGELKRLAEKNGGVQYE